MTRISLSAPCPVFVRSELDVAALVTDVCEEGLPDLEHVGVLPPGSRGLDGAEEDYESIRRHGRETSD